MQIKTNQPFFHHQAKINNIIASFWDKTSEAWQTIWGPHIHHGFYEMGETLSPKVAQEKLIDKLATLVSISPNDKILDVGCGMGGSSLILAKKYHATVSGITLSQKQVSIARQEADKEKIENVNFKIEDALSLTSFADQSMDVIWSLESCEQFFNKSLFIEQAFRVLKPGGRLMLATWCSDQDEYEGTLAKKYRKLCLAFDFYMPTLITIILLNQYGFKI